MKIIHFFYISILFFFISCRDSKFSVLGEIEKENIQFFIDFSDSLIEESISVEDLEYIRERQPLSVFDAEKICYLGDSLNSIFYTGRINHTDFPMFCELYQVDLCGDSQSEFVGILSCAQPIGGISYLYVFDNTNKLIGLSELSNKDYGFSFFFIKDEKTGYYEIKTISDDFRSINPVRKERRFKVENGVFGEVKKEIIELPPTKN